MKKYVTTLTIMAFLCHFNLYLIGQEVEGGCTTVEIIDLPSYPTVYTSAFGYGLCGSWPSEDPCVTPEVPCCRLAQGFVYATPPKFYLEMRRQNGSWQQVLGPIYNHGYIFNDLVKGTYRVRIYLPEANTIYCCPREVGQTTQLFTPNGIYIGLMGGYADESTGGILSNEVLVGPTDQNDINAFFIDPNNNNAFDVGQTVLFDASNSTHYDQWTINIAESGPSFSRWTTTGWQLGSQAGIFSISSLWNQTVGNFAPFHNYEVNFVIENNKCRNAIEWPTATWNNSFFNFFICPAGTGCKINKNDFNFTIAPNPASNFVRFPEINDIWQEGFFISLMDVAGRTLLYEPIRGDELDISNIPAGLYVINIARDGNILATKKLIIQK